jgi:ABC-2 type transport system ATP-binding protein
MLLGLIAPTSGEIRFHGRPIRPAKVLAEIGAMIETPAFYPHLSGRDNLRVLATYGGIDPVAIDHILRIVDLGKRGDDRFRTYSLGMKQRLGIAAALLKNPSLLILDEPTNGLDPAGMADMRRLIRDLADGERTVLVSSHLMGEVEAVCDRVGVIARGQMVAEGTIDELRGEERLRLTAEPAALAASAVRSMPGVRSVSVDGEVLTIAGDGLDAAEINRELVRCGIAVRGIGQERRSLEEVFLLLTGAKGDRDDNLLA